MFDPDRLKRTHVINVCYNNGEYFVVLESADKKDTWKIKWEVWISLPEFERRNQS